MTFCRQLFRGAQEMAGFGCRPCRELLPAVVQHFQHRSVVRAQTSAGHVLVQSPLKAHRFSGVFGRVLLVERDWRETVKKHRNHVAQEDRKVSLLSSGFVVDPLRGFIH